MIAAQRRVTDQRGNVQRGVGRFDRRAVIAEPWINKRRCAAEQVHRVRRIAFQTDRRSADPAVADNHRGHALAEFWQHLWLTDDHGVVVGVHVNKTRRQHAAGSVDCFGGLGIAQVADALDSTVEKRHVSAITGCVAAIDDQGVANQGVVQHVSLPAAGDRRRHGIRRERV